MNGNTHIIVSCGKVAFKVARNDFGRCMKAVAGAATGEPRKLCEFGLSGKKMLEFVKKFKRSKRG